MIIDIMKPIRSTRSGRHLYLKRWDEKMFLVDEIENGAHGAGAWYHWNGEPVTSFSWGPVENYEEPSPFAEVIDTEAAQMNDHELFGLF